MDAEDFIGDMLRRRPRGSREEAFMEFQREVAAAKPCDLEGEGSNVRLWKPLPKTRFRDNTVALT